MLAEKYVGVHIHITENGYELQQATAVSVKGGKLSILWTIQVPEMKDLVDVQQVIVGISGKGIIVKELSPQQSHDTDFRENILPNVNKDDFYFQKIQTENGAWTAVARRDKIENIVEAFTAAGFFVQDIMLWPVYVKYAEPIFPSEGVSIQLEHFLFSRGANGHVLIERNNEIIQSNAVKFEGLVVEANFIQSFVLASTLLFKQAVSVEADELSSITISRTNYRYRKLSMRLLYASGAVLLLLLLLNLPLNLHFGSKLNEKQALIDQYGDKWNESAKIREELLKIENQTGADLQTWSRASFFADRMASVISPEIQLTQLKIFPFVNEKEPDSLQFLNHQLAVTGLASNANAFNEWLKQVQAQSWCQSIAEQNFDHLVTENAGHFKVMIYVK